MQTLESVLWSVSCAIGWTFTLNGYLCSSIAYLSQGSLNYGISRKVSFIYRTLKIILDLADGFVVVLRRFLQHWWTSSVTLLFFIFFNGISIFRII